MKAKKILLFTATLSIQLSLAQFAKVVDQDGYVNVRENADAKSKIIGKINSDEVVYVFEHDEKTQWYTIDYKNNNGGTLNGYVHNSRLKFIESYEVIPSVVKNENKAIFKSGNIKVEIAAEKFNYKDHKKDFSSTNSGNQQQEDLYKGQQVWGTDGNIPNTHYKFITVWIGNRMIQIPQKDIENLFNVDNESAQCFFDPSNKALYITMLNSDGAGSYAVLFKIEKGIYKGKEIIIPF